MNQYDASLAEIAKRRSQVMDGASRGRHRGWDAAGLLTAVAGFAAQDLPVPSALRLTLFGVAVVAALACFTRAGRRGKAVMHRTQLTGRFWAVLGGLSLTAGAAVGAGVWLFGETDLPVRNTLLGVLTAVLIAAGEPLYRALLRRAEA
jgi:hypothetical protein